MLTYQFPKGLPIISSQQQKAPLYNTYKETAAHLKTNGKIRTSLVEGERQRMRNLKIGMRLALGFGVVMTLIVVTILIGVIQLGRQNDSADETSGDIYPKTAMAQNISYIAVDMARIVRNLILNKDPQAIASNKAALDKNKSQIEELINKIDRAVTLDKGRELMKVIKESHAAYISYTNNVVDLALNNNDSEATKTLFGENYKTQAAYLTALKNLVDYQEQRMNEGSAQQDAIYHNAFVLMVSLGVAALFIGTFFAYWVTRSITQPMQKAVDIARTVAEGDLTSRIEAASDDETGELLRALQAMNDSLIKIVSDVRSGTNAIATASSQISSGNADLSSRTEQQASSLEETASSMEELTSTVKQNSDNARQANQLAVSASDVAAKGGQVVSHVVETMGAINESAKKIADIIGVIDGIAFQTNILALNAAVEAARAGEQGRGFAVVASEVRNLAQRSANAAKEIKVLIGDSVEKVESGSKLVDQAGTTMEEVVSSVKRVSDIISEITAASHEQTSGIEQINQAITHMDESTQQNAALVEEAAAASASLQDQAEKLAQLVSVFKLDARQTVQMTTYSTPKAAPVLTQPRIASVPAQAKRTDRLPQRAPTSAASKRLTTVPEATTGDDWEEF